jgi:hypothetical protein
VKLIVISIALLIGIGACVSPANAVQVVESTSTVIAAKEPISAKQKLHKLSHKKKLSKKDVRYIVKWAMKNRKVPKSQRKWLEKASIDIIFNGAAESHGNAKAKNGQYRGILQMGNGWGTERQRMNPVTSIDWLARTYRQGGKYKVRQHWRATLGR